MCSSNNKPEELNSIKAKKKTNLSDLPLQLESQNNSETESFDSLRLKVIIKGKENITIKQAIFANLIIGVIALSIYFPLELEGGSINGEVYYYHVSVAVLSFLFLPILYLGGFQAVTGKQTYLFLSTRKGLKPKKIISSLIQGCVMHAGLFYPWIVLSQKYVPGVRRLLYFRRKPKAWFEWFFYVALNVIMFEYYSKSFIQLQFSEAKGSINFLRKKLSFSGSKLLGFILQNIVWLGGHVQEFLWLQEYIGTVNAIFFILVSGILTGLTVLETENIFGVAVGHVLLNILVTVTFIV